MMIVYVTEYYHKTSITVKLPTNAGKVLNIFLGNEHQLYLSQNSSCRIFTYAPKFWFYKVLVGKITPIQTIEQNLGFLN